MLIPFKELFARHKISVNGVLHLGANTGQEAEAYAAQGIKQVVWVEALPSLCTQLAKNVARYPETVALCACLSDKDDDVVTFHVANNQGQSSSFLEFDTHTKEHPTVRFISHHIMMTKRVDTLLRENYITVGPDWFLNVDLQGAELLALKGMGDLLWSFGDVYIEVNTAHLYKNCPLVQDIDYYLAQFGFVGVETKMTGSGWGDKYYRRL